MKILIIKPSSFGDIIQSNPVASALRKSYPDAEIKWLVFKAWEDLIGLFPDVSGKIIWDRKGGLKEYMRVLSDIRKEKFDLVIDLQGLARTALIARFSDAFKIVGVPGMKELSWLFVNEVYPESRNLNAVLRNLEVVRYLTEKTFEPVFKLKVPEEAIREAREIFFQKGINSGDKIAAFIPKARGNAKTWPAKYYDELAGLMQDKFRIKLIALGAPGDAKELKNTSIIDLTGRTSIQTLAACILSCKCVIGGDTGPTHLASALGIPTAVLFGGSDINETAPVSANAVLITKRLDCSPCRGKPSCQNYNCLTEITPAEVLNSLAGLNL